MCGFERMENQSMFKNNDSYVYKKGSKIKKQF